MTASAVGRLPLRVGSGTTVAPPLFIFLLSRALLAFVGWVAPNLLQPLNINRTFLPPGDPLNSIARWSSPWFRFDARWYVGVAEHGYHWGSPSVANTNFFPLYPLCIKWLSSLTLGSPWLAAWLISNIAFLGALIALWRWALLRWDSTTAGRVVVVFAVFPFGFFSMAPYAEPIFLCAAVAAFLWAEQDRWLLATYAAAAASVARPVGIALVLAVAIIALQRAGRRQALLTLSGFLPFLGFVLYLGVALGHPLGFTVYHTYGWVAPGGGIVQTVMSQFHTRLSPFDRIDAALVLLFVMSSWWVWQRLGAAYGIYVLLGVLLPLSRGLAGMERYVSVLFPAMVVWSIAAGRRMHIALFSASLILLIMAATMFTSGYSLF